MTSERSSNYRVTEDQDVYWNRCDDQVSRILLGMAAIQTSNPIPRISKQQTKNKAAIITLMAVINQERPPIKIQSKLEKKLQDNDCNENNWLFFHKTQSISRALWRSTKRTTQLEQI